jgi:hypothetical protein
VEFSIFSLLEGGSKGACPLASFSQGPRICALRFALGKNADGPWSEKLVVHYKGFNINLQTSYKFI